MCTKTKLYQAQVSVLVLKIALHTEPHTAYLGLGMPVAGRRPVSDTRILAVVVLNETAEQRKVKEVP